MYIGPERQLISVSPTVLQGLIDHAHVLAEEWQHTHAKDTLVRMIQTIVQLNAFGYDFIWNRHKHCVSARKRVAQTGGTHDELKRTTNT